MTSEPQALSGRSRAILLSVTIAIAIYVIAIVVIGYDEISASFGQVRMSTWAAALGLSLGSYLIRYVRWRWLLERQGAATPFWPGLAIYLGGFALTTTPGKIGETIRLWQLRQAYRVPITTSAPTFLFEQVMDVFAVAILATLAVASVLPDIDARLWLGFVVVSAALMPFVLGRSEKLFQALLGALARSRFKQFDDIEISGDLILSSLKALTTPVRLGGALLLGVAAWAAPGFGLFLILQDLGVALGAQAAIGFFMLSLLAGILSFISGGLGATEAALSVLLVGAGVDPAVALAAALVSRVSTLWFAVGLGACMTFVTAGVMSRARARLSAEDGAGIN